MKTIKNKKEILVLPEVVWLLKEIAVTHYKGHQRANMPKTKGLVWGSWLWQATEIPVEPLPSYPSPLPITASFSTNLSLGRIGKGLLPRHKTGFSQIVDPVRLQNHFVWIRQPIWALPDWPNYYLTRHCSSERCCPGCISMSFQYPGQPKIRNKRSLLHSPKRTSPW